MALRWVLGVCAIVVALSVGSGAAPAKRPMPAYKVVLAAIDRRRRTPDAARYRDVVQRTARLASLLPAARAARAALASWRRRRRLAPKLTAPRAAAIFGQLAANDDWFAHHGPVAPQTDITDADGLVYRYFSGRGFEFHPLGNFAALNAAVASKDEAATARLATALAARGVPEASGGTGWEYYFDYGGGRAPWTSGFAQAVAAQAFARAAALDTTDSSTLLAAARSAYRAIPGRLVRQTSYGPWIKLYSFNRAVVLNAQLQSAISLADYAKATSDSGAAGLAAALQSAAARALPSFSNGYWSYYQLPADPSPVNYQDYVVQLLQTLARRDDRFAGAAGAVRAVRQRRRRSSGSPTPAWARSPSGSRSPPRCTSPQPARVRGLSVVGRLAHGLARPAPAGRDLPGDDPGDRLEGELRGGPGAPDRPRLDAPEEAHEGEAEGRRRRLEHAAAARRRRRARAADTGAAAAAAGLRRREDDAGLARRLLGARPGRARSARPPAGRDEPRAAALCLLLARRRRRTGGARRLRGGRGDPGAGAPRPGRRPGAGERVCPGLRGVARRPSTTP